MVTLAETKTEFNNWISEDATVSFLEKAQAGKTTLEDIADALDEFKRLHDAGLASPAEVITLARAYPTNKVYTEAADGLDEDEDTKPMVVGGPASVELVDREGHLITTNALKKAFKKFMKNFRARNVMVMHSDVQVGHALPAYISKSGAIFKSGVDEKGLFFISELRGDTKISKRVRDQIEKGGMSSYSIAGSATKSKDIKKSDGNSVLQVDDMELAEVTICEKGVNQGAHFELLKGDKASGSCADGSCMTKHSEPTPTVQTEYVTISKEDINSIDMFNNWISKAAPMMAGATAKLPKTTASPSKVANVTGGIGMPVKMSMEKKKEEVNPYAIATAMAKKKGYKNFAEDSKGDKYRDKITEGIKESEGIKKSVQHIVKDAFHEMVAGIQKQPQDYGGIFQPGGTTNKKKDKSPSTGSDYGGFQPGGQTKANVNRKKGGYYPSKGTSLAGQKTEAQKKADKLASQVSMQTGGSTTGGVKTKEGSRKLDAITQQAGAAGATTEGARASTAAGRSIQRTEQLKRNYQDPDFRAEQKKIADARGMTYDAQKKEGFQTAQDPNRMRSIYDQASSAQGGKLTTAQSLAPSMDRSGGSQGMNYGGSMRDVGKPGHSGTKPKTDGKPPTPSFDSPTKPKKKDIDAQVESIVESIPKTFKKPPEPTGKDNKIKLDDVERATGDVKATDKFYGQAKKLTTRGAGIDRDKKITLPKTSTPSTTKPKQFGSGKFGGFSIPKFFGGK